MRGVAEIEPFLDLPRLTQVSARRPHDVPTCVVTNHQMQLENSHL